MKTQNPATCYLPVTHSIKRQRKVENKSMKRDNKALIKVIWCKLISDKEDVEVISINRD